MDEEESVPNILETQLLDAVHESLQNSIYSNASFLAERLLAERDCEEYKLLLAECYSAENKPQKSYSILKTCFSPQGRYRFALICLRLNRNQEAEKALLPSAALVNKPGSSLSLENIPNGSYGLYALAESLERQHKFDEARLFFSQALEQNPTLWKAYEKLCKMGDRNTSPTTIFNEVKYSKYESRKGKIGRQKQTEKIHSNEQFKGGDSPLEENQIDLSVKGNQLIGKYFIFIFKNLNKY